MKSTFRVALQCAGFLVVFSSPVLAQQATVSRNVNLRRDPSTSSPIITLLETGSRLTLVDADADSGFYHVKTEDDHVGWVWSKFVNLTSNPAPALAPSAVGECDSSLWLHVYHAGRLLIKQECVAVTGTIVDATDGKKHDGVRHEADGDTHGWLKLDSGFEDLLNAGNQSDEGGNLVFEIVCRFPIGKKATDAKSGMRGLYRPRACSSCGLARPHRRKIGTRYVSCEVDGDTSRHQHCGHSLTASDHNIEDPLRGLDAVQGCNF
jgi:hypothetical protein